MGDAVDPAELAERIEGLERPLLLALDVDGTLAPIVDDPSAARVPDAVRDRLERIEGCEGVELALVTGRDAFSLAEVAGEVRVWRAVSHGRLVLGPDEAPRGMDLDDAARSRLETFRRWAESEAMPQGARIEDKDGAVAVHVRALAQRDASGAEALLERARERAEREGLHARLGRAVCEAEVESGDKGTALEKLLAATGARGVVYAGDDLTDLPAIELAARRGGVGAFVRSSEREPPAQASAVLEGPGAVADLLEALTGPARG